MPGKHHTLKEVKKLAEKKGGICLSKEYTRATDKMKFQCSEGHIFEKDFKHILQRNQWCQKCSANISEEICRYIFEEILDIKFKKVKFKHKGHILELDGYNEEEKIAFEYNGKQHYEITSFIKTKEELDYRKHLDLLKREYCDNNNVNLIIIPYTIKNDELINFIKKELQIYEQVDLDINEFIDNYSYYKKRKNEISKIMSEIGGKLLHFGFDTLKVQCKHNHIWTSTVSILKKGHFCRICADKNKQRTFQDVLKTIKAVGIKCLSQENDYTKSGKSILSFKCENGHIFNDEVDYMLDRIKEPNRKNCQYCNTPRQNKALDKIKENGLIPVNFNDYSDRNDLIDWKCAHNHEQKDKAKNLLQNIRRGAILCKQCKSN